MVLGGGVLFVLWLTFRADEEARGLVIMSPPILTNNQYTLIVSNRSDRTIACATSSAQFRVGRSWIPLQAEHLFLLGQGGFAAPEVLKPRASIRISGHEPKYIEAPFEADAWRAGLIWRYERPTRLERFLSAFQGWIPIQLSPPSSPYRTNYSDVLIYGPAPLRKPATP